MRVEFWNPQIDSEIYAVAMERIESAAIILAEQIQSNLKSVIRHEISRPAYKTGKYAGQSWTARTAGALLKTVRVVKKPGERNIWIMEGNYNVYYAKIFEYSAIKGKKHFRPALKQARSAMESAVQTGANFHKGVEIKGQAMTLSIPHKLYYPGGE